jgi:four helix bundle protein
LSFAFSLSFILAFSLSFILRSGASIQLAKSATSVGANYEEAQGAYSKEDFSYKISICFREAKESNYWLRIMKAADISNSPDLDDLIQESNELKNIFGTMNKKIHYRNDV